MKTQCPHCLAYFNNKPDFVGKRTKCKNCGQGFVIAEASEVKPSPPSSGPAKITRSASLPLAPAKSEGLPAALRFPSLEAHEKTSYRSEKVIAGFEEQPAVPEIKISIEEPLEIAAIEAAGEDLADRETKVSSLAPLAAQKVQDAGAGPPEVQINIEEPLERPEIQVEAEGPVMASDSQARLASSNIFSEPTTTAEAAKIPGPFGSPGGNGQSRPLTASAREPLSAGPAQLQKTVEKSKSSIPPTPWPPAANPAFQAAAVAAPVGYGPAPAAYPNGSSLASANGLAGAGDSYPAAPQFPAGAPAYPGPPPAAPEAFGYPAASPWTTGGVRPIPGNGGLSTPDQPAFGQTLTKPMTGAQSPEKTDDHLADDSVIGRLKRLPRLVWVAVALVFLFGGLAGGKIGFRSGRAEMQILQESLLQAQQQLQIQKNEQVESLKKERLRLQDDLLRVTSYSRDYPEGSIPRALAQAASEEFKIADTLLLQQIAAVESGAKVTVAVKQTKPDPELAATLEAEMIKLEEEIARQWQTAKDLDETPKMLATTSIATQMVSLAILNRNLLIARYGLSSPVPLQYNSPNQSKPEPSPTPPPPGALTEGAEANQAELERIKKENEQLRAENEMLLNSDSTLYASAVSELSSGQLGSAEGKFSRLLQMFPASPLAPKAKEGLAEIKARAAEREAAKKPPIEIASTGVKHDGGYFRNQSYVRVSFKNISQMMIKRVEFKVLTFDEHGYPIASKRLDITQDNFFTAAMTENIAPGRSDYGVWELSEKVRQVKVRLKTVEFYDGPPWRDEDIELWVEKEGGRFKLNGQAS